MILKSVSYLHPEKRTMTTCAVHAQKGILHCPSPDTARLLSTDMHRQRPLDAEAGEAGNEESLALSLPGYSTVRLDYSTATARADEGDSLFPEESDSPASGAGHEEDSQGYPGGRDLFHLSLGDAMEAQQEGEGLFEKELAGLIDTGDRSRSLQDAVTMLDDMALSLGRGNRPGSLLTNLKEKIHQLANEKKEAATLPAELFSVVNTLKETRARVQSLEARRQSLQEQVDQLSRSHLERLESELAALKAAQEDLSSRRRLDSESMAEINRMTTLVETARHQLEKTSQELDVIREEMEQLPAGTSGESTPPPTFPNALERSMHQLMGKISENEARLDEIFKQIKTEDELIAVAQGELNSLPDFSRLPANPIDWLNQLLQSFKSAVESREREEQSCLRLREELNHLQNLWDIDGPVFEKAGDFTAMMVENEQKRKAAEGRYPLVAEEVSQEQNERDEKLSFQKSHQFLAIACFICLLLALGSFVVLGKTPLLWLVGLFLVCVVYFFLIATFAHRAVQRMNQIIAEGHAELDLLQEAINHKDTHIEELMIHLGCRTPRELEARYDTHKDRSRAITKTADKLAQEESLLEESEERIPALFERLCETLALVDEIPENAQAMDLCVTSAIAKYHRYKDIKRHLTDRQNFRQTLFNRKSHFEAEINQWQSAWQVHEDDLRTRMRQAGFSQESLYTELEDLCDRYRTFLEDAESSMDRGDLLARQRQKLEERIVTEEEQLQRYELQRGELLEKFGFATLKEARDAGEQGAELKALQKEMDCLAARKNQYLQGTTRVNGELLLPDELTRGDGDESLRQLSSSLSRCEKEYADARQRWLEAWRRYQKLTMEGRLPGIIEEELVCTGNSLETAQQLISAGALTASLIQESLLTGRPERCRRIAEKTAELLQALACEATVHITLTPQGQARVSVECEDETKTPPPLILYTAMKIATALTLAGTESHRQFIVDAALQQESPPFDADAFYTLLEALPDSWQKLVITENTILTEAGNARGWKAESL